MIRFLTFGSLTLLAACSCNSEQSYSFPDAVAPTYIDPPEDIGRYLSFDTSPDGSLLTMAYYDRSIGAIGYAVGTPQDDGTIAWLHEAIDGFPVGDDDPGDRGKYATQKTAKDGTVWAAYQDAKGGLYVSQRVAGPSSWTEPVLVDEDAGAWASLAFGADGEPIVAHQHPEEGVVRLSRYDGSSWSTETIWTGQDWSGVDEATGEPVTRAANVGQYLRLIVHDGVEYVAFYDAAQQSLSLLEGGADGYTHTVVDNVGHVGRWPSLWTDGDTLLIAYQDVGDQDLKLARRANGSWQKEIVDSGPYRGADTEVFMRGDRVAIVYFDGFENDMMLATRVGDGWEIETVGKTGGAVGYFNEVARVGDTFWLGSYDHTARGLFLASTN